MGKGKIPIIICLLLMLSLAGYLIFSKDKPVQTSSSSNTDGGIASASTVSPGAISLDKKDNSNNTYITPSLEYDDNKNNKEEDQMSNEPKEVLWTPATEMDLEPSSLTVYVNKEYCLPKDYVPENLVVPNITFDIKGKSERKLMREEAARAIEALFNAALDDGYELFGISGYRSYGRQKEIFLNNIVNKGKKHTLQYSAAPGTSEHQTGLAMDVSAKSIRYRLISAFANCEEGKWLAAHAHEYGFIIRYPKDRSSITGYAYEPWHIRYVGNDLANYLYTNNMTLDEYYNYTPSKDFDYEAKYAALINYVPPATPTPIPVPGLDLDGDGIPDLFVGDDIDGDGIIDVILDEDLDEDGLPDATIREDFDWDLLSEYFPDIDFDEYEDNVSDEVIDQDEDDIDDEDFDHKDHETDEIPEDEDGTSEENPDQDEDGVFDEIPNQDEDSNLDEIPNQDEDGVFDEIPNHGDDSISDEIPDEDEDDSLFSYPIELPNEF